MNWNGACFDPRMVKDTSSEPWTVNSLCPRCSESWRLASGNLVINLANTRVLQGDAGLILYVKQLVIQYSRGIRAVCIVSECSACFSNPSPTPPAPQSHMVKHKQADSPHNGTYLRIADGLNWWPNYEEGGSIGCGGHFPDRYIYMQGQSAIVEVVPY